MNDEGDLRQGERMLNFVATSDQAIAPKAKNAIFGMQDLAFSGVRMVLVSMATNVSLSTRRLRMLCLQCQQPNKRPKPRLRLNLRRRSKSMLVCPS